MALQYVPNHLKSVKMCKSAIERNGDALEFILPTMMITKEFCEIAVGNRSIERVELCSSEPVLRTDCNCNDETKQRDKLETEMEPI